MPFILLMTTVGVVGFFVLLASVCVLRITSCPTCGYGRLFEKPIRKGDPEIVESWCPSCKSLFEYKISRKTDNTGRIRRRKEIYPVKKNAPKPSWVEECL